MRVGLSPLLVTGEVERSFRKVGRRVASKPLSHQRNCNDCALWFMNVLGQLVPPPSQFTEWR